MTSFRSFLLRISLIAVSVFVSSLCCFADDGKPQQSKPNLSGTWKLNRAKSKLRPGHAVDSWLINHSEPRISMVYMSAGGSVTDSYVTDGKEHVAHSEYYEQLRAKAYWEGNALVIENHLESGNFQMTVWVSRYELSQDGAILVISKHFVKSSFREPFDELLTYDKQRQ